MDYYLDTEFIACEKQRRLFGLRVGPPIPTIDLISIGLVAADGRELYLLNADCEIDYAWADEWVRMNVLLPIWKEHIPTSLRHHTSFDLPVMRSIFRLRGVSRKMMTWQLLIFIHAEAYADHVGTMDSFFESPFTDSHRFFGYYADYDWVVFCQLFGAMSKLPKGFPMFCEDLHQLRLQMKISDSDKRLLFPNPIGEHNALVDARWNKALHDGLKSYRHNA